MARAFLRSIRGKKRQKLFANMPSDASKEIRAVVNKKVKPALVKAHERVVADWKSDVKFRSRVTITPDAIKIFIFPAGADKQVWTFVDKGTRPHIIKPKGPGYPLRFKTGYKPKTLPNPARTVYGGGGASGPEVRAMVVKHPGSEPRNFTKQIAKEMGPEIRAEIENAFRRVARRTNGK